MDSVYDDVNWKNFSNAICCAKGRFENQDHYELFTANLNVEGSHFGILFYMFIPKNNKNHGRN